MPSVGMRRSTRVFGARVLRSGRKLWRGPHEGSKYMRAANRESKWIEPADDSANGGGDAGNLSKELWQENENIFPVDMTAEPRAEWYASEVETELKNVNRMYGIVYRRKRKRTEVASTSATEDKRFGKTYSRKQWGKFCRGTEKLKICGDLLDSVSRSGVLAIVVNESSYDCDYRVTCFLTSVLSYMSRVRLGIRRLSTFVLSKTFSEAYSSNGVLFLQDFTTGKSTSVCIISGSRLFVPLISIGFSVIPFFFMQMHTSMHLRYAHLPCLLVVHSLGAHQKDEISIDVVVDAMEFSFPILTLVESCGSVAVRSQTSSQMHVPRNGNGMVASSNDTTEKRGLSHCTMGLAKSALLPMQLRNSRNIQKRRSSLRRKRGRPPLPFRSQKASGALASEFFRIKHDGLQLPDAAPGYLLRSVDKKSSRNSAVDTFTEDICPSRCSANLLITESDMCYREVGATITLELSASKQWFLAIMKDGIKRFNLIAEKVMRPSSSNRFTHATVWTENGSWKLEFPNKKDWLIFKELYRECSDRNIQASAASVIPVPRVQEVSSPVDTNDLPYARPDLYISVKDDELTRALDKKSSNYDMDSGDEEWLAKFNDDFCGEREPRDLITPEKFESVIDALEKGFHCNPDEHFDEKAAYEFSMHLERREVIEAISNYWIEKRKQKRASLIRTFQLYQPRRTQVIPKSILRKKRSFKRQASRGGRGKQHILLQAIAAERDAFERQNNANKLQEAKAVADRSDALAIVKRQKAQMLMENADLATYKAMMALRIAEAAQITGSPGAASSFLFHESSE